MVKRKMGWVWGFVGVCGVFWVFGFCFLFFPQRSGWRMAGTAFRCLHRQCASWPVFCPLITQVSPCLRLDDIHQSFCYLSLDTSQKVFDRRCETLNFQRTRKGSVSILAAWRLTQRSLAPVLASRTPQRREAEGGRSCCSATAFDFCCLLVLFFGGRRNTVSLSELLTFMENSIRRMEFSFWVDFKGLNRWILIATQITKRNQLYFH